MREILFKGKDKDGNWHEGFIRQIWSKIGEKERFVICPSLTFETDGWTDIGEVEIIPETVGQFTELTDKNGVKIFEGDIYKDSWGKLSVVEFFYADEHKTSGHGSSDRIIIVGLKLDFVPKQIEVIGNIHDNQELLNQ